MYITEVVATISSNMSVEAFIELASILWIFLGGSKVMVLVRVIAGSTVMIVSDIIAVSMAVICVGKTLGGSIVVRPG